MAAVAAALGALLWALSPAISGHVEPWDADSAYYLFALPVAGFVSGLIAGGPLWVQYAGAVLGQVLYGMLFIGLGPLMLLGLAFLVPYGLLFVLGGMLGIKVRKARAAAERGLSRRLALAGGQSGVALRIRYDGQSLQELLDLRGVYEQESLLQAIAGALLMQQTRRTLSREERYLLAIIAFEQSVTVGGYPQFIVHTPPDLARLSVPALNAIGCDKAAVLTEEALRAIEPDLPDEDGLRAARVDEPLVNRKLRECDVILASNDEEIKHRLWQWLEHNVDRIALRSSA